jgi:hypothetical protein
MNTRPEVRDPVEMTPRSFRRRYVNNPPRKKWRIMILLKATSKGKRKNRLFRG